MNIIDAGRSGSQDRPNQVLWKEIGLESEWVELCETMSGCASPREVQAEALREGRILNSRRNAIVSAPTNVISAPPGESTFSRHAVPWWQAPWFLSRDVTDEIAEMDTAERVRRFGSETLRRLFDAMEESAFRREYELTFEEDAGAFLSWDLLTANVRRIALANTWRELAGDGETLYAGMDVGRTQDASEIVAVCRDDGTLTVRRI